MTNACFLQEVNTALNLVKQEISNVLIGAPLPIRTYTKYLIKAEGKYVRAISILSVALEKNNYIDQNAIIAAAAIELVHLASLVHDDVIDDAEVRRGIVSLHKKYSKKIAIICGDYIFATAISLCGKIKALFDYQVLDYIRLIVLGELTQYENNYNYDLTIEKYLEIIAGKTAILFELSFLVGAIIAKESAINIETYKVIGHKTGIIFQLIDDSNNFEQSLFLAKKPVLSDFDEGVITLPVIYTFQQNSQALQDAKAGKLNSKNINQLVKLHNGIQYTRQLAEKYYTEIEELLNTIEITTDKKQQITNIVTGILRK